MAPSKLQNFRSSLTAKIKRQSRGSTFKDLLDDASSVIQHESPYRTSTDALSNLTKHDTASDTPTENSTLTPTNTNSNTKLDFDTSQTLKSFSSSPQRTLTISTTVSTPTIVNRENLSPTRDSNNILTTATASTSTSRPSTSSTNNLLLTPPTLTPNSSVHLLSTTHLPSSTSSLSIISPLQLKCYTQHAEFVRIPEPQPQHFDQLRDPMACMICRTTSHATLPSPSSPRTGSHHHHNHHHSSRNSKRRSSVTITPSSHYAHGAIPPGTFGEHSWRWKCRWCYLWICDSCKSDLEERYRRDLTTMITKRNGGPAGDDGMGIGVATG